MQIAPELSNAAMHPGHRSRERRFEAPDTLFEPGNSLVDVPRHSVEHVNVAFQPVIHASAIEQRFYVVRLSDRDLLVRFLVVEQLGDISFVKSEVLHVCDVGITDQRFSQIDAVDPAGRGS